MIKNEYTKEFENEEIDNNTNDYSNNSFYKSNIKILKDHLSTKKIEEYNILYLL